MRVTVTTLLVATLHCVMCIFCCVMWALRTLRSPFGFVDSSYNGSDDRSGAEYVQEISLYRNLGVIADTLTLVLNSQHFYLYLIRTPELR